MNLSQSNVIYVKTDGKPQNLRVHVVTEAGQDIPVGPVIHTIVSEAEGNWQPGAVFAYPGAVPPEGAYLLNGQTIPNCADAYPKFWEWVNTAGVWLIDNDTYEAELAKYGVCDGFVIDSAAGSVRLPKWKYQTPIRETLPVRGNGLVLGLTNGTDNVGVQRVSGNQTYFFGPSLGAYGQPVGSQTESLAILTGSFGVTTDPDNSGIVAENNAPTDHFVWCIQVYNAATALSEQESAQLASQMQMKAQSDLANAAANIDFIIKHEEATDGSWWYDLYRSGKVVQGGSLLHTKTEKITITLPIEMADNRYIALVCIDGEDGYFAASSYISHLSTFNRTVTTFDTWVGGTVAHLRGKQWRVEGKAATE